MIVSARERLILNYLMDKASQEVTIKELADHIDVSERTIHRDLKTIEPELKTFQLELVKRAGVGIKLVGTETNRHELKLAIQKQDYKEYTPDERMLVALCTLLAHQGTMKLITLANDVGVTTATISNDLDKLEPFVQEYGLTLIRRRGYGIELTGSEEAKRKAIRSLISDQFDVADFLTMIRDRIDRNSTNKLDSISERLLGLVEKEKLIIIENLINQMNARLPYPLADSSYVGLVVHLALAIERIQRGENISIKPEYLEQLKDSREFSFAKEIAVQLKETFQIEIPEDEVGYITMHLRGAKLRFEGKIDIEDENVEVAYLVQRLIEQVELLTDHHSLKDHFSLSQGLLAHLQPAIFRIKQGMNISNPLLPEIKKDYHELFLVVKEAVERVLPLEHVPDEEIGYLVLHFGAALNERQNRTNLKALIICSTGIGTSKMLATQLKNQFPDIAELKNISVFELEDLDVEKYDLILSTIPLEVQSANYLMVSPILTDEELEKIKAYIYKKGLSVASNRGAEPRQEKVDVTLSYEAYKSFTEQSQRLIELLDAMETFQREKPATIEEILADSSEWLVDRDLVIDGKELVQSLMHRERIGGLAIPGTMLALFHTRSEVVSRPSFHMIDLPLPMILKGMDGQQQEVMRILLLLAPEHSEPQQLELMSFISASIIDSPASINMFETAVKGKLIQYISQLYFTNFVQKLKE